MLKILLKTFKPSPQDRKEKKYTGELAMMDKMNGERQKFEIQCKQNVRIWVVFWFKKPKLLDSFQVTLSKPLSEEEVLRRMEVAFSDLG